MPVSTSIPRTLKPGELVAVFKSLRTPPREIRVTRLTGKKSRMGSQNGRHVLSLGWSRRGNTEERQLVRLPIQLQDDSGRQEAPSHSSSAIGGMSEMTTPSLGVHHVAGMSEEGNWKMKERPCGFVCSAVERHKMQNKDTFRRKLRLMTPFGLGSSEVRHCVANRCYVCFKFVLVTL